MWSLLGNTRNIKEFRSTFICWTLTVKNVIKYHMILSKGSTYGEFLHLLHLEPSFTVQDFCWVLLLVRRFHSTFCECTLFSSISWVSENDVQVNYCNFCASGTAQLASNIKFFILGFRLIILLIAYDAWILLETLPWHSTHFRGHFQMCKDNKLNRFPLRPNPCSWKAKYADPTSLLPLNYYGEY